MKKYIKYALTVVVSMALCVPTFADELEEDIEYEPIHATIVPGSGRLKFEDKFIDKKNYVVSNEDALLFKGSGKSVVMTNSVVFPVNAMQDYVLDFRFKVLKGSGMIMLGVAGYSVGISDMSFIKKGVYLCYDGQEEFVPMKRPKNDEKGVSDLKIQRHKNVITFFWNDMYVTEFVYKPQTPIMPVVISCVGRLEAELQSIRLEQGADDSAD